MTISKIDIQKNNLCAILAKIAHKLKYDMNIVCIFFTEINEFNDNLIKITILKNSSTNLCNDDFNKVVMDCLNYKRIEDIGLKICFKVENAVNVLNMLHRDFDNDFINSIILFDRTGEFTELKKEISTKNINKLLPVEKIKMY